MRHSITLLLTTIVAFLYSCNNESVINYKLHMSHNKAYEVEIPSDFTESESIGDLLAFSQEKSHSFIIIKSLKDGESFLHFTENNNTGRNFNYSLVHQTDSSRYYKVTRGTTMWSAHQLYMTKQIEDNQYVISISSDVLGKDKLITIMEHIQRSLTGLSQKTEIIKGNKDEDDDRNNTFTTRNTNYYSIDYPKEWSAVTNPDQMTDVYLGDPEGKIGCTILFFDVDYSLSELNEEGNANMRNAGAKITSNQKISINGLPCYKTIFEFSLGDTKVKQISYLFKKDETMFSVKFGNDKKEIDENNALIEKIMSSFKIK